MGVSLTEAKVKNEPTPNPVPAAGYKIIYDSHPDAPKGFGLRITKAGSKSFVLRFQVDGKWRWATIGKYPTWSLTAARKRAQELRREVDEGTDPVEAERERKAAETAAKAEAELQATLAERYTLAALCDAYVAHLSAEGKSKSAASTKSIIKVYLKEPPELAEIAAKPARDVTSDDIAQIVRRAKAVKSDRTAGLLRTYLSTAFSNARRAPYDARLPSELRDFAVTTNPVEVIAAIPVKRGERTLTRDELRSYILALGAELTDQALLLALFAGGQRMAQLLRARLNDYSPEDQTLLLWDGKGRRTSPRPHLIPLGHRAAEITAALAERAKSKSEDKNPSLFISRGSVVHDSTPGQRVTEIAQEMGGDSFNLRDIRRTVETMLASIGTDKDTRAQLLSHGLSGVQSAHYDRHDYLREKRAALLKWERHLQRLIDGDTEEDTDAESNVIEFRKAG